MLNVSRTTKKPIRLSRRLLVRLRLRLSWLLILAVSPISSAVAQDSFHVMILHDFWEQDNWGIEIDSSFSSALKASLGAQTNISAQYLGIQANRSAASLERERQHIEDMILDQGVDLVVTVLPAAGDFYRQMAQKFDLPAIYLLPGFESIPVEESSKPTIIVRSPWESSIQKTLDEMLLLFPDTTTIEVFSGDNVLDQVYAGRVKQVAEKFTNRVAFSYQDKLPPDQFRNYVRGMDADALVLALPYSAYGIDQKSGELSFLPDLFELSSVPTFGFSDLILGFGIVGGNLAKTENYGQTTAAVAHSILSGQDDYIAVSNTSTVSVYDWRQVDRWGISLGTLGSDYDLISVPDTLWQKYSIQIVSLINLFLLLCGVLLFQAISLRRTKLAHAKIAESEQQVRKSEEQYRLLASNSKDVIWTVDIASNTMNFCSPSIESLLGYTPEEMMTLPLVDTMTTNSRALFIATILKGDFKPQVLEIEHYTKQGDTVWCEIVAQISVSDSGEPMKWVGVTRDISQRKLDEADRLVLENQVRQSQKIESIGTLAGGIAHDFNNILGVVTGITDLLKIELKGSEKASRLLSNLMSASDKAKSLTNKILTFSRQSSGDKTVINLPLLLEESLDILQAGIPKTLIIKKEISAHKLNVKADSTHLEQVIINLLTNAAEANEGASGKISVSLKPHQLSATQEFAYGQLDAGDYAMLVVSDKGVGMNETQLSKVFEPFYTSKELGNGMGMAIVHGIVMDHQGAIDIVSSPGQGTTVSVLFPLTDEEVAPAIEAAELPIDSPASSRIMIIDDQEDLLDTVVQMLSHLGHECFPFSDARRALQVIDAESHRFDLIITDYSMPDLTGLELIDYCNQHHPTLPIVLSTGYKGSLEGMTDLQMDELNILYKPFKFAELEAMLRNAL